MMSNYGYKKNQSRSYLNHLVSQSPKPRFSSTLCMQSSCWLQILTLYQACTNSGVQIARATKFYTVATNICGTSVCNLLYVTLLTHRILRRLLVLRKICEPMLDTKLLHTVPYSDVTSPHYILVLAVISRICKCVRATVKGTRPPNTICSITSIAITLSRSLR